MTPEPIPVLTLWQPWASLVALGVKTIETRGWSTKYRGPLAIHAAGKKPRNVWAQEPPDLYDPIILERYLEITEDAHGSGSFLYEWRGPLGAILATCTLVDVAPIVDPAGVWMRTTQAGEHRIPGGCVATTQPRRDLEQPKLRLWRADDEYGEDIEAQRPYGDFTPGRYAWLLADVKPVDPPVAFKGGQGLSRKWTPASTEQSIA